MARKNKQQKDYTLVINAELDLHGHTAYEAQIAVDDFLREASSNDWSRIRIVVGKGTHSSDGHAVLPDVVKALLNQRGHTYTYAKIQDGGEGALEVSL